MALYWCNGEPNCRDNGCTCHSMFADGWEGSLLAKAPSWDGGIVRGPVFFRSTPSPSLPYPRCSSALVERDGITYLTVGGNLQMVLQVFTNAIRLRLTAILCDCSSSCGPIPDSCKSWRSDGSGGQQDLRSLNLETLAFVQEPSRWPLSCS